MAEQDPRVANLQTEYKEVCSNFRLLTDIRFKLLAFLPIGTGAGVALAATKEFSASSALIGLFGLVVTASAALYNLRNDQLYNELVARAAHLERLLNLRDGGFAERPRAWRMAGPFEVSHGQIWWIYLGSLAAWLFVILHSGQGSLAAWPFVILHDAGLPQAPFLSRMPPELFEAVTALGLVLLTGLWVLVQGQRTSRRLRKAATVAVDAVCDIPIMSPPENHKHWKDLLADMKVLAGSKPDVTKRFVFYWSDNAGGGYWDRPAAGSTCDKQTAAQLLGLVTDMPSRWIFDVASGRRASRDEPSRLLQFVRRMRDLFAVSRRAKAKA